MLETDYSELTDAELDYLLQNLDKFTLEEQSEVEIIAVDVLLLSRVETDATIRF